MPSLSTERWRVVSPYLDRALDVPHAERAAWLAALRREDEAIARDLEALLRAHDELSRDGFLDDAAAPAQPDASLAGLVVGAYTLRAPLGQGGMGTVWLADRSDGRFAGTAAVKLLNASLIGREGEARFKREGSVLARLKHPHIAQLIDAGVSSLGQPYLVLEHVDGERIDAHADAHALPVEARVRMFLDVLDAVAFAHANMVVHRDLKPSNVLVTTSGQVKLLDFGIAKLLDPDEERSSTLTREGAGALTPAYAAPEQLTGGAITTGTDVYSLGVLLFTLLAGAHPAGDAARAPAEWVKAIVDTEPPRPSEVARAPKELRGDLDTIVAKALRKQPTERYASVEAFADDLRRFLASQPISARRDSIAYRSMKFVRRNRVGVAAAGIVILAVIAGTAGIAWQAREARIQRDAARAQLARATATNEFTSFLLNVAAPGGKPFTVSQLLDQGESLIDKQFADDDTLRGAMLAMIGRQYMAAEDFERASKILGRAVELGKKVGDPVLVAEASCPLALASLATGERKIEESRALVTGALGGLSAGPHDAVLRADCLVDEANFSFFTDEADPMIRAASEALTLLDQAPIDAKFKRLDAEGSLAYGYYLARRNREADEAFARVMSGLEKMGRDRTIAAADTLNNWGQVHYLGDIGRAEPLLRRAYDLCREIEGPENVQPLSPYNLAGLLIPLGRYDEAEPLLKETMRVAAARDAGRFELDAMMELVDLYIDRGDLLAAERELGEIAKHENGPRMSPRRRVMLEYYRAHMAEARGDARAARDGYARAVKGFDAFDAKFEMDVLAWNGLSRTERIAGSAKAAIDAASHAVSLAQSFVEKDAPSYLVGLALSARGDAERAAGDADAARRSFQSAAEHLTKTLGTDHAATKDAARKAAL